MEEKRSIISFHPIGTIHSPFKERKGMPIQPKGAQDIRGKISVFPEYREGLADLAGFSHIVLLYFFHQSSGYSLKVISVFLWWNCCRWRGRNSIFKGWIFLTELPYWTLSPMFPFSILPPIFVPAGLKRGPEGFPMPPRTTGSSDYDYSLLW